MCSFSFFVVDVVGEHGGGRQGAGSGGERREGGTRRGALAGGRGMSASGGKWEEKGIKKTEMEGAGARPSKTSMRSSHRSTAMTYVLIQSNNLVFPGTGHGITSALI